MDHPVNDPADAGGVFDFVIPIAAAAAEFALVRVADENVRIRHRLNIRARIFFICFIFNASRKKDILYIIIPKKPVKSKPRFVKKPPGAVCVRRQRDIDLRKAFAYAFFAAMAACAAARRAIGTRKGEQET